MTKEQVCEGCDGTGGPSKNCAGCGGTGRRPPIIDGIDPRIALEIADACDRAGYLSANEKALIVLARAYRERCALEPGALREGVRWVTSRIERDAAPPHCPTCNCAMPSITYEPYRPANTADVAPSTDSTATNREGKS